jgi:hypothetical protein
MGPVGHRGKSGRRGFSAESPGAIIDKLSAELAETQRALEVQFMHIAQMQQEIDQLRARETERHP